MPNNLDDLKSTLFTAKDGVAACDAINALSKLANKGNEEAQAVLALYVSEGAIIHTREYACSCLAVSVSEPNTKYAVLFRKGLSNPEIRYWSILGYVNSAGKKAYKELIKIARNETIELDHRSHAIKCLADLSKQPFDRGLPSDPGHWKESDLRLSEIVAWAKAGSSDGKGYAEPIRHPALDKPKTDMEKIVARLDKKLAKKRTESQDLADPTNWLSVASPNDIKSIKARWDLPSTYFDFLTRFSPIKVILESRGFYNPFFLFGAAELIKAQDGYSFNPVELQPIKEWPAHMIVIASHGADPFVFDLSKSDGKDAPIATADAEALVWKFRRKAASFIEFLERLSK